MKEYSARRIGVLALGLVTISIGVWLFKISKMGNDPSSALSLALAALLGIRFSAVQISVHLVWFVFEIMLARKLIGIGTFMNWFGIGFAVDFLTCSVEPLLSIPDSLAFHIPIMLLGVIVISFGASLYQTADLGVAPYDSISIIMAERTPLPYFWCRIMTDSFCAAAAYLSGGIIGIGTLISALGLGPFISFFTEKAAKKLCGRG